MLIWFEASPRLCESSGGFINMPCGVENPLLALRPYNRFVVPSICPRGCIAIENGVTEEEACNRTCE